MPVSPDDEIVVAAQLGREPRGPWRVAARCGFGYPSVLEVGPVLDDGTPFPTYYWMSCPWLVEHVGALESTGAVSAWATRLAEDPSLASRMRAAEAAYVAARDAAADRESTVAGQGFAGQSDVLATKCLHAHAAARMVGLDDPVGEGVLEELERECPDERCATLVSNERGDARG
jgi:hypothetical protein